VSAALATVRTNIQAQGFCGLDDETYAQINYPLRCRRPSAWCGGGRTALGSATILWGLVPFAALGAIFTSHPFDVVYNHGCVIGSAPRHCPVRVSSPLRLRDGDRDADRGRPRVSGGHARARRHSRLVPRSCSARQREHRFLHPFLSRPDLCRQSAVCVITRAGTRAHAV